MAVVRSSLSAAGYQKARNLMKLNAFLGELVGAPKLLGEWSYQLHIYGEPSLTEPWGWQLTGHHLIITCFVLGDQMTLTPTFMGAEPKYADAGKYAGLVAFEDEERLGLEFARNLSAEQKAKAIFSDSLLPDRLPPGRHQGVDGLMLAAREPICNKRLGEYRLSLLLRRQVAGKLQAEALFVLECDDPGIFSLIHISRLRAHEGRRQRHLLAQDETGENQMMAAQLPSPGLGPGRLAEHVQLVDHSPSSRGAPTSSPRKAFSFISFRVFS